MNWPPETTGDWVWLFVIMIVVSVCVGIGRGIGYELAQTWFS